ncbi:pyruvate kinase alpha/beta domain-containing protein [Syntrophomonas palmitatica]|uniref:pyruvate kinase alpha/beta domain-containing protein n=1 Tax=Syntrophomonas palmitatica TaxID=402877 RepID=UPI0006D0A3B1|nr:pyruvate kinase alpha/beta domain-containing protein [Syntrophomonas palmitatica]
MFWEYAGRQNTQGTLDLAIARARALNLQYLLVASCSGETAQLALEQGAGLEIICVTHHNGFQNPGENEMDPAVRQELMQKGVKVLTATHFFAGADRALRNQFGGVYPSEIMAQTLRIMGQGLKVAVEIAIMALDAGLIPYNQEVVSIGGTIEGADTAIVAAPAHSKNFFKTEVREIICMPRSKKIAAD